MSNPPEPTNLTQKFAALQEQMTAQHNALLLRIDEMRGEGPENTLKSLNQSVWNLAGPAPGTTLTDIYDVINLIRGGDGYPLISLAQLKSAVDSIRGDEGVKSLADLHSQLVVVNNTIDSIRGDEGERTLADIWLVLTNLLLQFDTSVIYPTMKDLMLTISQQQAQQLALSGNPLSTMPPGVCASPFTNTGIEYISITAQLIEPMTMATWPTTVPDGFEGITTESGGWAVGQTIVRCDDWSQYKIYVASNATMFGVSVVNLQKFNTNEWITLSGNMGFEFYTNGSENLEVYICPVGAPALGACPGSEDPLAVTSWWRPSYGPIPAHTTWYGRAWTGGATWSANTSFVIIAATYDGFSITRSVDYVGLCLSWDVSAEATIDQIGIHAYYQGAEIANTFEVVTIAMSGTVQSTILEMNLNGILQYLPDIVLIPYVAFTDNHALPPNVTISVAWVPMGMS